MDLSNNLEFYEHLKNRLEEEKISQTIIDNAINIMQDKSIDWFEIKEHIGLGKERDEFTKSLSIEEADIQHKFWAVINRIANEEQVDSNNLPRSSKSVESKYKVPSSTKANPRSKRSRMEETDDESDDRMKYSRKLQELKREVAFIKNALLDSTKTILSPNTATYPYYYKLVTDCNRLLENQQLSRFKLDCTNSNLKFETNELENKWKELKKKRNLEEVAEQHPIFKDVIEEHLFKNSRINAKLSHQIDTVINGKIPDFSFFNGSIQHFFHLLFLVELQCGEIDDSHRGRIIDYNHKVLLKNPNRTFIISALTNLDEMIIFHSERTSDNSVRHMSSIRIDFWEEGLKCIRQMLLNPELVGYDQNYDPRIEIKNNSNQSVTTYHLYDDKLGEGGSSTVYSLNRIENNREIKAENQYVAKVFKNIEDFIAEKEIFEELNFRMDKILKKQSSRFIKMEQFNEETLTVIFQPKCQPIEINKETNINKIMKNMNGSIEKSRKIVMQMFECIEEIRKLDIIHRDIKPEHFMKRFDTNEIVLIDFGTAIFLPQTDFCGDFRGTIEFAAFEILRSIVEFKPYIPHRRHDLESFVRTLWCYLSGLELPYEALRDKSVYERAKIMLHFWLIADCLNFWRFWKEALDIAREDKEGQNQLDRLRDHINSLFIMNKYEYYST